MPKYNQNMAISNLISFVRSQVQLKYSKHLAERLEHLHQDTIDEGPEQRTILVSSLRSFILFMIRNLELIEPDIDVSYSGNIIAIWHKSNEQHLSAEFMPDDNKIQYVVFARLLDNEKLISRKGGKTTIETLMYDLAPYNITSWIVDQAL